MRKWRTQQVETLYEHPLLALEVRQLKSVAEEDTARREAFVLNTPDWVNVIPITEEGRILLIRQWRYGIEQFTLEIPGGVVEEGEDPKETASRELLEETGYRADRVVPLGMVHPNPAIHNNRTFTFLAQGLEQIGPPEGDGEEEIEVTGVRPEEIPELVRSGKITHSLVIAAFHLWEIHHP